VTRSADTRLGMLLAIALLALNVASVSRAWGSSTSPSRSGVRPLALRGDGARRRGPPRPAEGAALLLRLAVPALVRALTRLGLSVNAGFFLVTNAVLFGFLLVLWLHLRDLGFALPSGSRDSSSSASPRAPCGGSSTSTG